jgi:hypothetical protein
VASRTHWLGDLGDQLREFFGIADPMLDLAMFDELTERLARDEVVIDEVQADLQAGVFAITPRDTSRPSRPTWRLQTRRFDVLVHREYYGPACSEILVLDNAHRRRSRLTDSQVSTRPARVRLHRPADTPSCDIDRLMEDLRNRQLLFEAERTLTTVRLDPRRHTHLRDRAQRTFDSLRAMLQLAEAQAMFVGEPVMGTVVEGPAPGRLAVWFEEAAIAGDPEVLPAFAVHPLGNPAAGLRLHVADIDEDTVVFESIWPRDRAKLRGLAVPGQRVAVSGTGRSGYRPHLFAVSAFLQGQTAGNWTALATLLCEPGNLAHPTGQVDRVDDVTVPLDEQQVAVAGVLEAPHAFLVQGPPGTGKTQVIAESVRRLIARGERVLLTAPTHVALDEVLERVASEPGVLPVRLHWNDEEVREDLRRFTRSGYTSTMTSSIRTPTTSRLASWDAQHREFTTMLRAVDDWQAAQQTRTLAAGALAQAQREAGQRALERSELIRRHDTALAQVRQHLDHRWAELQRVDTQLTEVRAQRELLQRSRGWLGRLADSLGVGAVVRLSNREQRLGPAREVASAAYRAVYERHNHDLALRAQVLAAVTAQDHDDRARVDAMLAHLQHLDRRRAEIGANLTSLGLDHVRHDNVASAGTRQALAATVDRFAALIEVQQRWFDLIGLTGKETDQALVAARATVGGMLAGSANLVCSTTVGFGGARVFRDLDYDSLIVDEASKVTVGEFLIPAVRARRWILVGDEKQLTPFVDGSLERHLHAMSAVHLTERDSTVDLPTAVNQLARLWHEFDDEEQHPFRVDNVLKAARELAESKAWAISYRPLYGAAIGRIAGRPTGVESGLLEAMHGHLITSLFERCASLIPEGGPRVRLVTQRRMTPQIAELVKGPIYGGQYLSPPDDDPDLPRPLLTPTFRRPVVYFDTSAQVRPWDELTPHGSYTNALEAEWTAALCRRWNDDLREIGVRGRTSISVLAFYSAQTRLIKELLGYPAYASFPKLQFKVVDAIDKVQGQQSDIVIVSFCRTYGRPRDPARPRTPRRRGAPAPTPGPGYARWLQNLNRLNVACTRARRSLVLVGHGETLRQLGTRSDGQTTPAGHFYQNLFGQPETVLDIAIDFAQVAGHR